MSANSRRAAISFLASFAAALARPLCRWTSNALGQHKSNYRLQRAIDTTETLSTADRDIHPYSALDIVTRFSL